MLKNSGVELIEGRECWSTRIRSKSHRHRIGSDGAGYPGIEHVISCNEALDSGRAAETLFHDNPIKMDHRDVPSVVFSNPPIGAVGMTEARAQREYGEIDIYSARFKPMKNTLSGREERTLMKLIVDARTDRVLGCQMLGPDAPEILQGLAIAVKCGVSKRMFDETIGIHPSAAEEFVTMREKTARQKMAAE